MVICFDIGGTKIAKAVIEIEEGGRFDFLEQEEEKNPNEAGKIEEILRSYSLEKREQFGASKVAISSARIVDDEEKVVKGAESVFGKDVFDFYFLEKEGFKLKLENDGRCFALGEYFATEEKPEVLLTIALGTGAGCGLIAGGKIYRGFHGSALEASHMTVKKDGFVCNCGERGHWEAHSFGKGIQNSYFELSGEQEEAKKVFELAETGDEVAKKALQEAEDYLVLGVFNLLNILDPQKVVFGGSISENREFMERVLSRLKTEELFNKKAGDYQFEVSKLKNQANLLGAASLWLNSPSF